MQQPSCCLQRGEIFIPDVQGMLLPGSSSRIQRDLLRPMPTNFADRCECCCGGVDGGVYEPLSAVVKGALNSVSVRSRAFQCHVFPPIEIWPELVINH